jgi:hypothetical protein
MIGALSLAAFSNGGPDNELVCCWLQGLEGRVELA